MLPKAEKAIVAAKDGYEIQLTHRQDDSKLRGRCDESC